MRRLTDIAFSGDGEPTTYRNFDQIIEACAALTKGSDLVLTGSAEKSRDPLVGLKLVLITNASMFHRPHVERGLAILDENNGEIWAKLDAGTEGYFQTIDRSPIPLHQILTNITAAAKIV